MLSTLSQSFECFLIFIDLKLFFTIILKTGCNAETIAVGEATQIWVCPQIWLHPQIWGSEV